MQISANPNAANIYQHNLCTFSTNMTDFIQSVLNVRAHMTWSSLTVT